METMRWENNRLLLLDQTKLPERIEYIDCNCPDTVGQAIKRLSVRGAPAIGAAAAYGLVLGALELMDKSEEEFLAGVKEVAARLSATRPTAVNLNWALERMLARLESSRGKANRGETNQGEANQGEANQGEASQGEVGEGFGINNGKVSAKGGLGNIRPMIEIMLAEAHDIHSEDLEGNRRMGRYALEFIPQGARILTHCNAGALATAGYGTALGVIRAAQEAGKNIEVFADETRPLLQGARLTAWEMVQEGIPVTLITDSMAAYLMRKKKVDLVVVGSDRIAGNGDVANKIGTYGVAVLARQHGLPFYVAAPVSTVDLKLSSGEEIPIEERDPLEVTSFGGVNTAPPGVKVWNPAFDVTPAELVTAIITDRGVALPPYEKSLAAMVLGDGSNKK